MGMKHKLGDQIVNDPDYQKYKDNYKMLVIDRGTWAQTFYRIEYFVQQAALLGFDFESVTKSIWLPNRCYYESFSQNDLTKSRIAFMVRLEMVKCFSRKNMNCKVIEPLVSQSWCLPKIKMRH